MKVIFSYLRVLILGILLGAGGSKVIGMYWQYARPPQVSVINLTGETVTDVRVMLNDAKAAVSEIRHGRAGTVSVEGLRGEASTRVEWKDSTGMHSGMADDYVEGIGGYRPKVVLTKEKTVEAFY